MDQCGNDTQVEILSDSFEKLEFDITATNCSYRVSNPDKVQLELEGQGVEVYNLTEDGKLEQATGQFNELTTFYILATEQTTLKLTKRSANSTTDEENQPDTPTEDTKDEPDTSTITKEECDSQSLFFNAEKSLCEPF